MNGRNDWHSLPVKEVLTQFHVDSKVGLAAAEVLARQQQYGKNSLPLAEQPSFIKNFFNQFRSPLIYLLLLASLAAFFLGEVRDSWVILGVVFLNSVIGVIQETRAEKSLKELQNITKIKTRVLRDGKERVVSALELVPGDIVLFNAGDAISADIRLIEAAAVQASEAVLTGESMPVEKTVEEVSLNSVLGDRSCILYSGTFITTGRATGVVVATGTATELGQIAELTSSVEEPLTSLMIKVNHFSHQIIFVSIFVFFFIIILGFIQGIPLNEIIMISISQVVSIVPEGLPVAMTIAAAIGVQRLAARKTIVRKLSAVEALGAITVICSDKTGTLTLNEMSVTKINIHPAQEQDADHLTKFFQVAVLCNDASFHEDKGTGDPTEIALLKAGAERGIMKSELNKQFPRLDEVPFSSELKFMATLHQTANQENFIAIKGSVDSVLNLCSLSEEEKEQIKKLNEEMASEALRVLAFAVIHHGKLDNLTNAKFLGLMGLMDPPREEAKKAIALCRQAGIRPVMITGDHKLTGLAIARQIGIANEGDLALDGAELDTESIPLTTVSVFSRVHPAQKLKIIEAFQKQGEVVAMTGDGVNDAPALSKADVGVAMGITGTEVAKEASKIIITDDNFATIVTAIEEGRLVYQNIKKIVLLLVSTSFAELCILILALLLGFPAPFTAVQILWNNLVTEGVITLNLIMDPPDGSEMKRNPISKNEPLLDKKIIQRMALIVPVIIFCSLGWYVWRINSGLEVAVARTEALTVLVFCEWFNVLNCRSQTMSALNLNIFKNRWLVSGLVVGNVLHALLVFWPPLGNVFHTVPIDVKIVPLMISIASMVLWVEEIRKLIARRNK